MGLHLVAKHPLRGSETSFDGVTGFHKDWPAERRAIFVQDNPRIPDAVDLHIIEGGSEERLTMTRRSFGSETSAEGFFPAMRALLGDPPLASGAIQLPDAPAQEGARLVEGMPLAIEPGSALEATDYEAYALAPDRVLILSKHIPIDSEPGPPPESGVYAVVEYGDQDDVEP